jgi:transposase
MELEKWVKRIVEEEKKKRKMPLEVKMLNKNYYLYYSTTRWDKNEKRIKKVTRYIGRITPKGVVESRKKYDIRTVYEYGNSQFLLVLAQDIMDALEKSFYYRWKEILACAIVKTIQSVPLRLIKSRWEKLHLSQIIDASLSKNTISDMLREIGRDYASQKQFFDTLIDKSKLLAFDISCLFSQSENLRYAEKGYNNEHLYLKQINFMMLFSLDKHLPVFLKPFPGSVRDVKAIKAIIDEINVKDCVVVLDRGFASYHLPTLLRKNLFNFILPLRRNFEIINYDIEMKKSFIYRNRGIKWNKTKVGDNFLYVFEDVKLRSEEETTFIQLMEEKRKNRSDYLKESKRFGKIAILSNLNLSGEKIYGMFKNREEIEVVFDALKNELENDKTYLNDEDAIRGYFFISFLSLYLHCRILKLLKEKNLIGRISVNQVLLELSKVYEVHIGEKKKLSEIPEKVNEIVNALGVDIFPKKLGS